MSRLAPVAHRILIRPDRIEDEAVLEDEFKDLKKTGFAIAHVDGGEKRKKRAVTVGEVLDIGWMAWKAIDGNLEGWKPWAQVGDRVHFGRYAGEQVIDPDTKEVLFFINDEDILAVERAQ
jgi:co-chaperonin GroES (HSP10)